MNQTLNNTLDSFNNTLIPEPDAASRILNNTLNNEPDVAGRILNNTLNPEQTLQVVV